MIVFTAFTSIFIYKFLNEKEDSLNQTKNEIIISFCLVKNETFTKFFNSIKLVNELESKTYVNKLFLNDIKSFKLQRGLNQTKIITDQYFQKRFPFGFPIKQVETENQNLLFSNKNLYKAFLLFFILFLIYFLILKLNQLKFRNHLKIKLKTKQLFKEKFLFFFFNNSSTKTICTVITNFFLDNPYIFIDKIIEKKKENSLVLLCQHSFLNPQPEEEVVLSRDFTKFNLCAGTEGIIRKVLINQKVEVEFFKDSFYKNVFLKNHLLKFEYSLVKKQDLKKI